MAKLDNKRSKRVLYIEDTLSSIEHLSINWLMIPVLRYSLAIKYVTLFYYLFLFFSWICDRNAWHLIMIGERKFLEQIETFRTKNKEKEALKFSIVIKLIDDWSNTTSDCIRFTYARKFTSYFELTCINYPIDRNVSFIKKYYTKKNNSITIIPRKRGQQDQWWMFNDAYSRLRKIWKKKEKKIWNNTSRKFARQSLFSGTSSIFSLIGRLYAKKMLILC